MVKTQLRKKNRKNIFLIVTLYNYKQTILNEWNDNLH